MCNCINEINQRYEDRHLYTNVLDNRVGIPLHKDGSNRQPNKGPSVIVADFCPFCGEQYHKDRK